MLNSEKENYRILGLQKTAFSGDKNCLSQRSVRLPWQEKYMHHWMQGTQAWDKEALRGQ